MERLIDAIVNLVNQIREDENSDQITEYADDVVDAYIRFAKSSKNIFAELDQAFMEAPDLYMLILSVLFELFKNRLFLDKAEEILLTNKLSWDATTAVYLQIESLRFQMEGTESTYENCRETAAFMTEKFMSLLQVNIEPRPYEKRNHNRILITSDTLLSVKHAPTQLLLELSKMLQKDLGYEVLLGIHVSKTSPVIKNMWLFPEEKNYNKEADGLFCVPYEGCELRGYQQLVDEEHLDSVRDYIQFVKDWNPEFIWHVGGFSPLTEILGKMTTLAASSCIAECAVSDAQIVFNATEEAQKYLDGKGQKSLSFWIKMPIKEAEKLSNASQYGFEEDNFIIAIVGNRLDGEISDAFIDLMKDLLSDNANLRFVTIGRCSINWKNYGIEKQVCQFGYSDDLMADLSVVDLYLNPKRIGGGISALYALSAGTPVVTLPDCDVARNCGEDFTCQDYDAMKILVKRYYDNKDFYNSQRELGLKKTEEARKNDNISACNDIVKQIVSWMEQGVLN